MTATAVIKLCDGSRYTVTNLESVAGGFSFSDAQCLGHSTNAVPRKSSLRWVRTRDVARVYDAAPLARA